MMYNEEFIKGVTYGDVEDLMYSAQDEGFLTFLDNFRGLAELHSQEMLEGFIDDHFPENSKDFSTFLESDDSDCKDLTVDDFVDSVLPIWNTPTKFEKFDNEDTPIPGASKKLNKLIKKIRKHRE